MAVAAGSFCGCGCFVGVEPGAAQPPRVEQPDQYKVACVRCMAAGWQLSLVGAVQPQLRCGAGAAMPQQQP